MACWNIFVQEAKFAAENSFWGKLGAKLKVLCWIFAVLVEKF